MIDYLERLEAEVMRAARAEEARGRRVALPRPRLRPEPFVAVAAACAAIAAAVVFLPRAAETERERQPVRSGPAPAAVVGSYSRDGDALIIDPDRYTIDTATHEFVGDVRAAQGVLSFAGGTTGPCAGRDAGRYTYARAGADLRLRALQEPCEEREAALTSGSWRRDDAP